MSVPATGNFVNRPAAPAQTTPNPIPKPGAGKTETEIVKEYRERISKIDEEFAVRMDEHLKPSRKVPFKPLGYDRLFPDKFMGLDYENQEKMQALSKEKGELCRDLAAFMKDNNYLENESIAAITGQSLGEAIPFVRSRSLWDLVPSVISWVNRVANRKQNGILQAKFDARDETTAALKETLDKINDETRTNTERLEYLTEYVNKLDSALQSKKELYEELAAQNLQVGPSEIKAFFEDFENARSKENLDGLKLQSYQNIANLMADIYAKQDPVNAEKFRVLASGMVEIASHVSTFRKYKDLGSLVVNMGSIAGIASVVLNVVGKLLSDAKDPSDVLSEQIRNLAQMTSQIREEMHERFERVENIMDRHHIETLEEFSKLKNIGYKILDVCQEIKRKNDLVFKVAVNGFRDQQWSKFEDNEGNARSFINVPIVTKYAEWLGIWCGRSDTLSCNAAVTGRQDKVARDPSSVVQFLTDEKLENVINYLAGYFNFPNTNYANAQMWYKSVINYVYTRRYILENKPQFETSLEEGHRIDFLRLFFKGEQLKKQVMDIQNLFATERPGNTIRKQLDAYSKSIKAVQAWGPTELEKRIRLNDPLLTELEANYLLLKFLIQFSFNSSYQLDPYFSSFLNDGGLTDRENLTLFSNRLASAKDEKNFVYQEFFHRQSTIFKTFETILIAKAKAIQENRSSDNLRLVEQGLEHLYRLEDLVYPTQKSSRPEKSDPPMQYTDKITLPIEDLIFAAKIGDVKNLERLIAAGVKDTPDVLGRTALHYAAAAGDKSVIKILIKADPEALLKEDKGGNTPFHLAAEQDDGGIFEALEPNAPAVVGYLEAILQKQNLAKKTPTIFSKEKEGKFSAAAEKYLRATLLSKSASYSSAPQETQKVLVSPYIKTPFLMDNGNVSISLTSKLNNKINQYHRGGGMSILNYMDFDVTITDRKKGIHCQLPLSKLVFNVPLWSFSFQMKKHGDFYLIYGVAAVKVNVIKERQQDAATSDVTIQCFMSLIDAKTSRVINLEKVGPMTGRGHPAVEKLEKEHSFQPKWFEAQNNSFLVGFENREKMLYGLEGKNIPLTTL